MTMTGTGPEAAARFIKFVNGSPTPYHAVQNAALRLEKAGFLKVRLSFLSALHKVI
jgi:aspartyl aminopeptidase